MRLTVPADTRAIIMRLRHAHDPDEIAIRTRVDEQIILAVLAACGAPMHARWWVRRNRTGRVWQVSSRRAAYLRAQIKGLVDWDCGKGPVPSVLLLASPTGPQVRA